MVLRTCACKPILASNCKM
nr:unnamed protein product [Callosobruchus chinensis]